MPAQANEGQRHPVQAQQRPTKANADQQRAEGQRIPTKANAGQQMPAQANEGQRRPTQRRWLVLFFTFVSNILKNLFFS